MQCFAKKISCPYDYFTSDILTPSHSGLCNSRTSNKIKSDVLYYFICVHYDLRSRCYPILVGKIRMSHRIKNRLSVVQNLDLETVNKINPSGVVGTGQIIIIYLNLIKTLNIF